MSDVKISGLPSDSSLDGNHYVPINDPTGPATKRTLLSTLAAFLFNQANIPSGSGSPITRDDEMFYDFVVSGLVWSGDAYASTRNASMTAGVVYINGRRISMSAVVARTFTASKDTYIDILDNADGTGTLVYTEVTNNVASPALAANSIRIGIIITGASNIASVGSVNQGQQDKVLPIASSVAYSVTDSLGNLICNRTPTPGLIGYRQIISTFTTTSTTPVAITGLACPAIIPAGRRVRVTLSSSGITNNTAGNTALAQIFKGTINASNIICQSQATPYSAGVQATNVNYGYDYSATTVTNTYTAALSVTPGGTGSMLSYATPNPPGYVSVELI